MSQDFQVSIQGEKLLIPYRVHIPPPNAFLLALIPKGPKERLYCKLTRHHDGHVREEFIKKVIISDNPLVAPFIIRLCGEYVIEILKAIQANLGSYNQDHLRAFILENPRFYEQNRSRMVSYWDCYYRSAFPRIKDYVGFKIFQLLDELARPA
jgi:hypothetical protein